MQALEQLCERLASVDSEQPNLRQRLQWCAEAGVFRWFVPKAFGGWEWSDAEQIEGYLALSQSCLTTAFVLTQWNAACKRIVQSENEALRKRWLPAMARGEVMATVGISHLTTSRQHLAKPALHATEQADGSWILEGFSPWVTAAALAELLVVGGTAEDGRQILCAVPTTRPGVEVGPGVSLVALSESATDAVRFHRVSVQCEELLAGPIPNVMQSGAGGGTGGLQTSTLAVGLTLAAVKFLQTQAAQRSELQPVADKLLHDAQELREALMRLASGDSRSWRRPSAESSGSWRRQSSEDQGGGESRGGALNAGASSYGTGYGGGLGSFEVRERANSLVLRATQAALVAAKGAGFVTGHSAGRWCREALFFLVWSCPQPVLAANLCEFAQV